MNDLCLYPADPLPQFQSSPPAETAKSRTAWWLEQAERLLQKQREMGKILPRAKMIHRLLERVLQEEPSLFQEEKVYLWEQLAQVYDQAGDLSGMEACLRIQAKLQPGRSDAFLNLGYYLERAGQKQAAISAYWEGLTVDPEDQYIIYNLAELHRSAGEQEKALAILDHAISHSERPALLLKIKGDILLQWGQFTLSSLAYQLALERLDRALEGFRLEIYLRLSTCYQRSGNLPQAVRMLEQGLAVDQSNVTILHELTRMYCMLKRYQEAVLRGEQLLRQDPGDPETCLLLGICYEQLAEPAIAKWYRLRGEHETRRQAY